MIAGIINRIWVENTMKNITYNDFLKQFDYKENYLWLKHCIYALFLPESYKFKFYILI